MWSFVKFRNRDNEGSCIRGQISVHICITTDFCATEDFEASLVICGLTGRDFWSKYVLRCWFYFVKVIPRSVPFQVQIASVWICFEKREMGDFKKTSRTFIEMSDSNVFTWNDCIDLPHIHAPLADRAVHRCQEPCILGHIPGSYGLQVLKNI